jgi:hypothetical protein
MPTHLRAVLCAATCSAAVIGVGGCLPLWKRASIGGCCVSIEWVPVWQGLTDNRPASSVQTVVTGNHNRDTCLMLLAVAGGVGAFVYGVRRPRTRPLEAGDYADGPGGSALDGRA